MADRAGAKTAWSIRDNQTRRVVSQTRLCAMQRMGQALFGVCLLFAGCAARPLPPVPAPAAPLHPEFVYPALPSGTPAPQATRIESAWRFLQADDLRTAERAFQDALKGQPQFHPADAGLGYVQLARRDAKSAVSHFDRALKTSADYAPALVGRGLALLEVNREGEALASFEAALKADPSLIELRGRIEVLKFRAVQDNLARAQAATNAGRLEEARAAYAQAIVASPESAFLYRELALVERKAGDTAAALEHLRKTIELDPSDARAHAQIGAILDEQGDLTGALAAYEKARALDPSEVPGEVLMRLRDGAALAKMPAEYRAIPASANITRAELAALLGVRLAPLISTAQLRQAVVTDVRSNWAQDWIVSVVRAGVMETQPNYTFQPAGRVRRGDLANIVARTLGLIAQRYPARATAWLGTTPKISDVDPGHLSYAAVSQAVASGVMPLNDGAFELLRPVSGAEAVDVISRLEALAKP